MFDVIWPWLQLGLCTVLIGGAAPVLVRNGERIAQLTGLILIGTVGAIILINHMGLNVQFLHISLYTPFLILLYVVAMRAAFAYQRRTAVARPQSSPAAARELKIAVIHYAAAAAVVVAVGIWLPFIGLDIARTMGWQTTFVGTMLVAAVIMSGIFVVAVLFRPDSRVHGTNSWMNMSIARGLSVQLIRQLPDRTIGDDTTKPQSEPRLADDD